MAATVFAAPALAQDAPDVGGAQRRSTGPTLFANFGWNNTMPADRFAPISIDIGPLDKPLAGTVVLEYPQDATQSSRLVVPFAATPNLPTRVQAVAAVPSNIDRLTISIYNERGRLIQTTIYGSGSPLKLPDFVQPESQAALVAIGRVGAAEAMSSWREASAILPIAQRLRTPAAGVASSDSMLERAQILTGEARDLPLSAVAYEGILALVLRADEATETDPRALEAVREWVLSGGRLVIVATAPGDSWRRWLPDSAQPPIQLAPPAPGPVPASVGSLISTFDRKLRDRARDFAEAGERHDPISPPASMAPQRMISVLPGAGTRGWAIRWAPDNQAEGNAEQGLLAEGPVGFGRVLILGIDPARCSQVLSMRAAGPVWRDALQAVGADAAATIQENASMGWSQTRVRSALMVAIERVGDVPMIGDAIFVTIAACILLLAILVGPVDFFALRRLRLAQRSWLTAAMWALLAALGAYALPPLLRTAPTQINRAGAIDILFGAPQGAAGLSRAEHAWATTLTGVYAAQSGRAEFEVAPASWWRGVAVSNPWDMHGGKSGAVVPIVQSAAGGELGSQRSAPLRSIPLALWTLRTFMDLSRPSLNMGVKITRSGDGWDAVLSGLPEGAIVTDGVLRVGSAWCPIVSEVRALDAPATAPLPPTVHVSAGVEPTPAGQHDGPVWTGRFAQGARNGTTPAMWAPVHVAEYWSGTTYYTPGAMLDLPGASVRSATIDTLAGTGRWAVLCLNIERWPPDARMSWNARHTGVRVLRLVAPLPESLAAELEEHNRPSDPAAEANEHPEESVEPDQPTHPAPAAPPGENP